YERVRVCFSSVFIIICFVLLLANLLFKEKIWFSGVTVSREMVINRFLLLLGELKAPVLVYD
ncbi:hypothetical protein DOY81_011262, partial [Sarcophaga bullata]